MKFRLVAKIIDSGEEIRRTVEAPDEETVRKYAEANGIELISLERVVSRAPKRGRSVKDKSRTHGRFAVMGSMGSHLRKYPPFLIAMIAATILLPVVIFAVAQFRYWLATLAPHHVVGGDFFFQSGRIISPKMLYLSFLFPTTAYAVFFYALVMITLTLCHLIRKDVSSTK